MYAGGIIVPRNFSIDNLCKPEYHQGIPITAHTPTGPQIK